MCVLIHKPAGVLVPESLIGSAVGQNADGWGVMGHTSRGRVIVDRQRHVNAEQIIEYLSAHRDSELAIHLRRRTHGLASLDNAHPFEADRGLYVMHNGSFHMNVGDSDSSDTWHLVHDILRPLADRHRGLLTDPRFGDLLDSVVSSDNRLVLFDTSRRTFRIINRQSGTDHDGLWISSLRWLDAHLFSPEQPRELAIPA